MCPFTSKSRNMQLKLNDLINESRKKILKANNIPLETVEKFLNLGSFMYSDNIDITKRTIKATGVFAKIRSSTKFLYDCFGTPCIID